MVVYVKDGKAYVECSPDGSQKEEYIAYNPHDELVIDALLGLIQLKDSRLAAMQKERDNWKASRDRLCAAVNDGKQLSAVLDSNAAMQEVVNEAVKVKNLATETNTVNVCGLLKAVTRYQKGHSQ